MNGWKNHATWNAALWLFNDELLCRVAARCRKYRTPYEATVRALAAEGIDCTGDGVRYSDKRISRKEMNAAIREL